VVSNIVFIALAIYTFLDGDIERVLHGADFRGELCGVDGLSGKEYLFWPAPTVDLDLKLCLEGCPVVYTPSTICLYEPDHETSTGTCYDSYESRAFNK
jgi:hypothetical protein